MKFNRPLCISLLQSLSLIVLTLAIGYLLNLRLWFCSLFVSFLLLAIMLGINHYQQRRSEALRRLISAIRFSDYSLSFNEQGKKGIDPLLAQALTQALDTFRQREFASEEKQLYYATLLSTIDSGLIVLNRQHDIEWFNQATLRELQLTDLKHLSDLKGIEVDLPARLVHLKAGETIIVRTKQKGQLHELAFTSVLFRVKNKTLSLVSLKNIHSVLENKELEAWQKLIRVLTHEIMNSLAPIISLSETLLERNRNTLTAGPQPFLNTQALETIHRRSKGLLEFVQNYRKLTRIPSPQLSTVPLTDLFNDLHRLHCHPGIHYRFTAVPSALYIQADRAQMEQVLINLIRNAEEACQGISHPQITVSAVRESPKVLLTIQDNGCGIVPEALDKIFVPFFTTKPGGSGIGLSLCKQIITLHGGEISASSTPEQGTCFSITLPET